MIHNEELNRIFFYYFLGVILIYGIVWILFSLTVASPIRRKLKQAGEEPLVDLNIFSSITILTILCYKANFLERKHPGGYIAYHNWRVIKSASTLYHYAVAWVVQSLGLISAIFLIASAITM